MITTQVSFIDRNNAETWSVSNELESVEDAIQYLLQRPPDNASINDTYIATVKISEGTYLYFRGYQGAWELADRHDYEQTWMDEYKEATKARARMDELKSEGKVTPYVPANPETREKLEKLRQRSQDSSRRKQDRYLV